MSATMVFRALLIGASGMVVDVDAKTALLVIDVQDCFLEAACTANGLDGTLSVPACHIIEKINQIRTQMSCLFDEVIFTQDYHPANHISWGSTHGLAPFAHLGGKGGLPLKCIRPTSGSTSDGACCPAFHLDPSMDCSSTLCPPTGWSYTVNNSGIVDGNPACATCRDNPSACFDMEQAMWTDHCPQDGDSGFPPSLIKNAGERVVQKGRNTFVDAYSGFMDNTQTLKTELDDQLQSAGIDTLFVVGIATDVCVKWTVTDALGNKTGNYQVTVIKDATAAVLGNQEWFNSSVAAMAAAGATIATTEEVLAMSCPTTSAPTSAPTSEKGSSVMQEHSQASAGRIHKHQHDHPQRFLSASMMELGQGALSKTQVEHRDSESHETTHISNNEDEHTEL